MTGSSIVQCGYTQCLFEPRLHKRPCTLHRRHDLPVHKLGSGRNLVCVHLYNSMMPARDLIQINGFQKSRSERHHSPEHGENVPDPLTLLQTVVLSAQAATHGKQSP